MKKYFSLIELFVLIALMLLLSNLLVPALTKTVGTAESIQCQSNLRQIHSGLIWYTEDDLNQALPAHWIYLGSYNYWTWDQALRPYLNDSIQDWNKFQGTVYECPSLPDRSITTGSYGANRFIFPNLWTNSTEDNSKRLKFSDLSRPSELVLISDTSQRADGRVESSFGICGGDPNIPNSLIPLENNDDIPGGLPAIRYRHIGDRSVAVFGDGHIGFLELGLVQVKNIVP